MLIEFIITSRWRKDPSPSGEGGPFCEAKWWKRQVKGAEALRASWRNLRSAPQWMRQILNIKFPSSPCFAGTFPAGEGSFRFFDVLRKYKSRVPCRYSGRNNIFAVPPDFNRKSVLSAYSHTPRCDNGALSVKAYCTFRLRPRKSIRALTPYGAFTDTPLSEKVLKCVTTLPHRFTLRIIHPFPYFVKSVSKKFTFTLLCLSCNQSAFQV